MSADLSGWGWDEARLLVSGDTVAGSLTPCDPIWQATLFSFEKGFSW